jgi:hypothetical protein
MITKPQTRNFPIRSAQSAVIPMQVSATQTNGIDINNIMNAMLPLMIVMMMTSMMTQAIE